MKILIVEDNDFKSDQLKSYLNEIGFSQIVIKCSYNSALNELLSGEKFDIVLLDISLPSYDEKNAGASFMPAGGKHLFSQIYLNDIQSKVIVVTLYKRFEDGTDIEQLHDTFKINYSDIYLGYVLFNNNDIKWQADLLHTLKTISND